MAEQFDSLNDKTKKIEIALKYTRGDMAKAKAMSSGQYQDIITVKGKFIIPEQSKSGMFLVCFNIFDEYIAHVCSVETSNDSIYKSVRIFDDWKSLYNDLTAYSDGNDVVDDSAFNGYLLDSLISSDVFPDVQEGNLDSLSRTITDVLRKYFRVENLQAQIELEDTSSLQLEAGGISYDVPGAQAEETPAAEEKPQKQQPLNDLDLKMKQIEEEANYVVDAKTIVSPVKGKFVNDINKGEKIMVLLTGKDPLTRKILTVLDAYGPNGEIRAIKGRLKEKIPMEKSGSVLYALVAKGVLARIIEEENVKIQMEAPDLEAIGKKEENNRLMYLMAVLVGLIIVAGIILLQML